MIDIEINPDLCIGCGYCIENCPEVFQWGSNQKALVINPQKCEFCNCEEIVQNCPTQAIIFKQF